VNLILVFVLFNFILGGILDKMISFVTDNGILGIRIICLLFLTGFVSSFKENKQLRWQFLFSTNRKLTRDYFIMLVLINSVFYGIKATYEPKR